MRDGACRTLREEAGERLQGGRNEEPDQESHFNAMLRMLLIILGQQQKSVGLIWWQRQRIRRVMRSDLSLEELPHLRGQVERGLENILEGQ